MPLYPPPSTGGGSSPTTTKGDLAGYSTVSARVPVGTNGQVLMADSTAALGVSYGFLGSASVLNYVNNPSFETAYTGWSTYGGFTNAPARVTTFAQSGTTSSFQDNGASANDGGLISNQFALDAGTYTFSIYAKLSSTVTNANIIVRSGAGLHVQINQAYPGNTNFNRYTGTFTLASAQTGVEMLLGMGSYGTSSPGSVYYDAIQIEQGSSATTYFDGSTTSGGGFTYSWTGTTGVSQSRKSQQAALTNTDYLPEGTTNRYFANSLAVAAMSGASITPNNVSASTLNAAQLYSDSYRHNLSTKTAAYTITDGDTNILADSTTASFTVTLPDASGRQGREYMIKKTNTANTVTIGTTSSQTIDGITTYALATQYKYVRVVSNNTNWFIIGNN